MGPFILRICFITVAIIFSGGIAFALPTCGGSPVQRWVDTSNWHNCQGKISGTNVFYEGAWKNGKRNGYGTFLINGAKYTGQFRNNDPHGVGTMEFEGNKYVGEWKNSEFSGQGIYYKKNGTITEGIWEKSKFQFAKKTPYSDGTITPSILRVEFQKISQKQRMQIQQRLKGLNLYKASVDGVYGKGTAGALVEYNNKILVKADLKKLENVTKLLNSLLEQVPKIKPTKDAEVKEMERIIAIQKEFDLNFYGGFFHSARMPNTLFFFDDIRQNDSFEFRKALRTHDINLIVLSSPGGSVWEGLQMAAIIHDKKLKTYVSYNSFDGAGNCASACSFMFFAGANRVAKGYLGVHQFKSAKASDEEEIGATQKRSQETVSEIIGFLNEFETPPWVFERMFQQKEMYYFKKNEILQIETEVSEETKAQHEKAESFITDLTAAFEK